MRNYEWMKKLTFRRKPDPRPGRKVLAALSSDDGEWDLTDSFGDENLDLPFVSPDTPDEDRADGAPSGADAPAGEDGDTPDYSVHTPLERLELTVRTCISLRRSGYATLEDLLEADEKDLAQVRNLNQRCLEEIRILRESWLQAHPDYTPSPHPERKSAAEQLQELVGLEPIKQQIQQLAAFARLQKLGRESGRFPGPLVLNAVFSGNPGTAKTTVARLYAGILQEMGLLRSAECVEVGRSQIVGRYQGHTADNVRQLFQKADGKLLLIDEAYALVESDGGYNFGDEAINAILQEMENRRGNTVVIFAGYPDRMEEFLSRNPGLSSRIPFRIHFPDYSAEELCRIIALETQQRGFAVAEAAREPLLALCREASRQANFGNGRFCRNVAEKAILSYAGRVCGEEACADLDFTLQPCDFPGVDSLLPARPACPAMRPIGFLAQG